MKIGGMKDAASQEIQTRNSQQPEQNRAEKKERSTDTAVNTEDVQAPKTIIRESDNETELHSRTHGDSYVSSEKELHEASGLYSLSRGSDGELEIKFDDIKLEKTRNTLKQQILKLQSSQSPEDREKTEALKKKLAAVEKKIRAQKQK